MQQLLLVSKLLRLLLQLLLHLPEELLRCSIHGHSSAMRRETTASNDRKEDEARAREATTEAGDGPETKCDRRVRRLAVASEQCVRRRLQTDEQQRRRATEQASRTESASRPRDAGGRERPRDGRDKNKDTSSWLLVGYLLVTSWLLAGY